jgi:hypothetical protein
MALFVDVLFFKLHIFLSHVMQAINAKAILEF